jgi:threonine dehydratase
VSTQAVGPQAPALSLERIQAAHAASAAIVKRTPVLTSASITERCGGRIMLKAECLQTTGSFKLRGALNKLRAVTADGAPCAGVVAGSAGNHAQSLAYAARHMGVPCEVFMPTQAAISKLGAVRAFGAVVHQQGTSVDDCVALAKERAAEAGLQFVHPFDDHDVICGQAGLGIELAQDVPDLKKLIVPIGGGGLASGVAAALRHLGVDVEIIGVQAAVCSPFAQLRHGGSGAVPAAPQTLADGIAIKRPGELTLPLIEQLLDDVVSVDEEAIGEAMVFMLERAKLVVEGAGAAAVAALLSGEVAPAANGSTVAILSGGNVDIGVVAATAAHFETRAGRRARLFTHVRDRPGGLAELLAHVAKTGANVISLEHVRDGVELPVRETGVMLTVETQGGEHLLAVRQALRAEGYEVSG